MPRKSKTTTKEKAVAVVDTTTPEKQLQKMMSTFVHSFESFVLFSFPWGKPGTPLENYSGPDDWQMDLIRDIDKEMLSVEESIDKVLRFAAGSGNGSGKTTFIAWIILWGLSTFSKTRITVTANTDTQLRTKTWPELTKWYHMFIAKHWFTCTATAIYSVNPNLEKNWRADAVPWSAANPAAFAGLHNKDLRIILIMDEASEIADIIWEVSEGALTDENTEIFWFAFGNRTVNTGRFARCFKQDKADWNTRCIDTRNCKMSNKALIKRWIDKYGIDSDFVRIHVLGDEPLSNPSQYIEQELITKARGRHIGEEKYRFAPVIIACDPAWQGGDATVIFLRQGLMSKKLLDVPKNTNDIEIANALARFEDQYKADAVFIDLGYGTGIYSAGKTMGREWMLISFGSKSGSPGYYNKRAEMYGLLRDWLKEGGIFPDDQRLCEELSWIDTCPRVDGRIQIIDKEDMEASPNIADALALTFAMPVVKKTVKVRGPEFTPGHYEPFAEQGGYSRETNDSSRYNPLE